MSHEDQMTLSINFLLFAKNKEEHLSLASFLWVTLIFLTKPGSSLILVQSKLECMSLVKLIQARLIFASEG